MNNKVLIIDYGICNISSVINAIKFIDPRTKIYFKKKNIDNASHIILPGVGAFNTGMKNLNKLDWIDKIKLKAKQGVPILGICLGMQLLAERSMEFGCHDGLGIIDAVVEKISTYSKKKIVHIGWSDVIQSSKSKLLDKEKITPFYFNHSLAVLFEKLSCATSYFKLEKKFVASFEKDNIFGVQFHPEKSHQYGLRLLKRFMSI